VVQEEVVVPKKKKELESAHVSIRQHTSYKEVAKKEELYVLPSRETGRNDFQLPLEIFFGNSYKVST
jgi:hypothetical protein